MHHIPFRDWLFYKYTLRLDYVLNDAWRLGLHHLRKALVQRGIASARRWSRHYRPFWSDISRQIAELVLESSLSIAITAVQDNKDTGHKEATFQYRDWLCPAGPRYPDEAVHIDCFEVVVDLDDRRAVRVTLDGAPMEIGQEALTRTFLALSINHHSTLHAYANWACSPGDPDPLLARAAVYTLSINATALCTGTVVQDDPRTIQRVLTYNGAKGIYQHGAGRLLADLLPYSRTTRFLLGARKATMEVIAEHAVAVDAEAFFLMSILHSVDHHFASVGCDPMDLQSEVLAYRGAELIRVLFSEPLTPIFANTRLSNQDTPWARDLYQRLKAVDAEYAAMVDYCIAY